MSNEVFVTKSKNLFKISKVDSQHKTRGLGVFFSVEEVTLLKFTIHFVLTEIKGKQSYL